MRFFDNNTTNLGAYCEPNSFDGPAEDPSIAEPPLRISGDADRYNHSDGIDDYKQPGDLFRLMNDGEKARLFCNYAAAQQGVPQDILDRGTAHMDNADPAYGAGVRAELAKR